MRKAECGMIVEAEYKCGKCKRYDEKRRVCRKYDRTMGPNMGCSEFEMQLADHFVPNIWDEWKNRKERERNERAVNRKNR